MCFVACEDQRSPHASTQGGFDYIFENECEDLLLDDLFNRRILPLLESGREPSCARCHLPGVDFIPFVKEEECETYLCMTEEGLIDPNVPSESKILDWISRGHQVINRSLESDPIARAEYEAFAYWIVYQNKCHQQVCDQPSHQSCEQYSVHHLDSGSESLPDFGFTFDQGSALDHEITSNQDADMSSLDGGSSAPDDEGSIIDTGHSNVDPCSKQGIFTRFVSDVWPFHGRCYHCHSDQYSASSRQRPPPPAWISNNREYLGGLLTADRLLNGDYIDLSHPPASLILLKPLAEDMGGLPHAGGTKMANLEDPLYVPLLAWIEQVAECQREESLGR